MAGASQPKPAPLSVETFRDLIASRPDEERWELIDGVAMMMAPPSARHQRIAGNLEQLLFAALKDHASHLMVYRDVGVNVAPVVENYDPEPDLVVLDAGVDKTGDERYFDRFYLAAEVVSTSDRNIVESKREVYRRHPSCVCVLTIRQDRVELRVDLRVGSSWTERVLRDPNDELVLAEFGLRCMVADLYRETGLHI